MKNSSLRHLFFYFLAFFFSLSLFAQTNQNSLYEQVLIGTKEGLFQVNNYQTQSLWAEAGIHKIIYTDRYYFLTTKGVYESKDLQSFTSKNTGLPAHSVKTIENGEKTFSLLNVDLKDFASHPTRPEILVTATKDAVYISRDSADSWKSLGSSARTAGCKSIAVCDLPRYNSSGAITGSELIVFMSHPIYGLSYIQADSANPQWIDITRGFDSLPNNPLVDEIADILPVISIDANGNQTIDVFLSQSFIPRLYSLDWKNKKAVPLWKGSLVNASFDSLVYENGALHFLEMGGFSTLNIAESKIQKTPPQQINGFKAFVIKILLLKPLLSTQVTQAVLFLSMNFGCST